MKLARFLLVHALMLGTLAFVAWVLLVTRGAWSFRPSLDTLAAVGVAVVLTGLFLLLVALPLQKLFGRTRSLALRLLVGALSGPIGVWLGLIALSRYPIDAQWYIVRAWQLHAVYAGVGLSFSLAWHRKLRSGESFKPTPLRGVARFRG